MRAVPEAERAAALALLAAARQEAVEGLRAAPLAVNTPWRRRRRDDADARLAELEAAMRLFQQPQVFLPLDTPPVQSLEEGSSDSPPRGGDEDPREAQADGTRACSDGAPSWRLARRASEAA
jgi:hypothetical protein